MSENQKYQVNMWVAQQSFILRTNSKKEFLGFTGIKKFDSKSTLKYLYTLNDMGGFDLPADTAKGTAAVKAPQKQKAIAAPVDARTPLFPTASVTTPDYETHIREALHKMGATNVKDGLVLFKKLTGLSLKSLPKKENFSTLELQRMYGQLLKGQHNGKKR